MSEITLIQQLNTDTCNCKNEIFATHVKYFFDDTTNNCISIQEIKEKNSCTGLETYRYVIENSSGELVPVVDIYPDFVDTDVIDNCVKTIYEKDACIKIDGSIDTYEAIKVYTRHPITGDIIPIKFESNFGVPITGTIEEVCCGCNDLCVIPTTPTLILQAHNTYSASIGGQIGCSDKFSASLDIRWQITVYRDGVLIHSSSTSPILTSIASALAWASSNSGGYWADNTGGVWGTSGNSYLAPDASEPNEYLIVFTETVNGNTWCGSTPATQQWGFTNRGTTFGTGCDNAEAFVNGITWANRSSFNWAC